MSLSVKSVNLAYDALCKLNPVAADYEIEEYNKNFEFKENSVIGLYPKHDGGFESVYINISNITPEQINMWDDVKHSVRNTPFINHRMNGISRLGWI